MHSYPASFGKQSIELHFGYAVQAPRSRPIGVHDGDLASFAEQQAFVLELVERIRHARPTYPEHLGEIIMGQRQVIVLKSIASQKQPTGHTRLNVTQCVGTCAVGDLDAEAMHITKLARREFVAFCHRALQIFNSNTPCHDLHLHDRSIGRTRAAKHEG